MSESDKKEVRLFWALRLAEKKGWKKVAVVDGVEVVVIDVGSAITIIKSRRPHLGSEASTRGAAVEALSGLIECEGVVVRREA